MKIIDILTESVSPIVYHATDFISAKKILTDNALKSKAGFISTTRSLTGSYHTTNRIIGVIFQLDGNLLNQKYKSKPVGSEYYDYDTGEFVPGGGKSNGQLEDRVFTSEISPLNKYVKSAIIFIPFSYIGDHDADEFDTDYKSQLTVIGTVKKLLDKLGITSRYIDSERDLYKPNIKGR